VLLPPSPPFFSPLYSNLPLRPRCTAGSWPNGCSIRFWFNFGRRCRRLRNCYERFLPWPLWKGSSSRPTPSCLVLAIMSHLAASHEQSKQILLHPHFPVGCLLLFSSTLKSGARGEELQVSKQSVPPMLVGFRRRQWKPILVGTQPSRRNTNFFGTPYGTLTLVQYMSSREHLLFIRAAST
jgi:hypothetical protein